MNTTDTTYPVLYDYATGSAFFLYQGPEPDFRGDLECAPLHADGTWDPEEAYDVAFGCIAEEDAARCEVIRAALRELEALDRPQEEERLAIKRLGTTFRDHTDEEVRVAEEAAYGRPPETFRGHAEEDRAYGRLPELPLFGGQA